MAGLIRMRNIFLKRRLLNQLQFCNLKSPFPALPVGRSIHKSYPSLPQAGGSARAFSCRIVAYCIGFLSFHKLLQKQMVTSH